MKIAFALPYGYSTPKGYDPVSGLSVYTKGLAESLVKRGHEVTVLVAKWALPEDSRRGYDLNGVTVVPLDGSEMTFAEAVHGYLTAHPQDVVEAHQWNYPLILEQMIGNTPTVVRCASSVRDVAESGGWFEGKVPEHFGEMTLRQFHLSRHKLEEASLRGASLILAAGEKAAIRSRQAGAFGIEMLPLGIDPPAHVHETTPSTQVLVMIGRFDNPRKGGEYVEGILDQIPTKYSVVVLGQNPSNRFRRRENVGWIQEVLPTEKLYQLYRESMAVIVPTKSESFGYVLLEPLVHGKPVICFDLDDASKKRWPLWRLGPPGEGSLKGIGEALRRAVELHPEEEALFLKFASEFYWSQLLPKYLAAYRKAIARHTEGALS